MLDAAATAKVDGDQRFDGTKTGPDRGRVGASVQGPSDRVNDEARSALVKSVGRRRFRGGCGIWQRH
jgi:hypothetical protein